MSSSKDFQFCFICQNRFSFSVSNNYHFDSDYSPREKNSFGATFDTEKDRRTELAQRFCTLASRYLNFDFNFNNESDSKLKKNTLIKATARKRTGGGVSAINSVNTRNSSRRRIEIENEAELDPEIDQCRQCCPLCFPIAQSFCDFYEQWTLIQVKLDQGTRRIAELMRLRLQSPKRSGQMGDFRTKFLANVSKGGGRQQRYENIPKRSLSLERRDANTQDDDDDFEADTGSMNLDAFDSDRFSGNDEDIDDDYETPGGTSASRRRVIRIVRDGERNSAKTVATKSGESAPTHFKCRFCGRMFTKKHKWLLQEHERMHTGERPFKCGICGKRFNRRAACRVHQRSAHGKLKGEAEILKEVQSQTEVDEDHVDLEKRNSASNPGKKLLMPRFKCGICRKEFLHSFSCSRHLRISHRIEKAEERKGKIRTIERNENDAEVDVDMTPVTSDFEVSNIEIVPYIKTERAEDEDSEIQDGDDDRDLDSNLDMAVEVHGSEQNDPDFSPTRQQKKSPKTRRRQVGVTEYACQYCGKRVFRKRDLENHERVHTKKRPFKCPKCEQTFAQKSGCKKHMIMKHNVAEEETLEMEIVQEELEVVDSVPTDSMEGTLTVKKIIRPKSSKPELDPSIELPLKCQFCGKGFKLKHNWLLVEHERIHTGERPFKCSICGKRYNRRAKCRFHQRGVHKGKGKVIGPEDQVNDDDVEVEVLTDQEDKNKKGKEKKFKCGVCGREFSQSFSCSRHVQTVHKIEKVLERQAMVVSLSLDSNKQIVVGKKSRPSKYETDSEEDDDHEDEDDYENFDQMEVPALPAPENE